MESETKFNNNLNTGQNEQTSEPVHKLTHGKFFFFGCWNRRGSKNQNVCTDYVVKDIKSANINYNDLYDLGVILGDNIPLVRANWYT